MSDQDLPIACPECEALEAAADGLDRRDFLLAAGGTALTVAAVGSLPAVARAADQPRQKPAKPAEDLVRELFATMSADQKKVLVLPWNDGGEKGRRPTRLRMYNSPIKGLAIGKHYSKAQQELIERILFAISSDEAGFKQLTRNGTYDTGAGLVQCGAVIFGDPTGGQKFAWVFTGHHLTVRCDGNSEEGAAFGGPMFYGHSPNGYSSRNCFSYQTKSVVSIHDALTGPQRDKAVVKGTPGEGEESVRFRPRDKAKPGIAYNELTKDQQALVEKVMRDIVSPYRKEDADEVMDIVKSNGGLEKLSLAFYPDHSMNDHEPWHFWRLEGPGFVWNYRVLPHVHTYVNISSKI
jgi:hypothetical protein